MTLFDFSEDSGTRRVTRASAGDGQGSRSLRMADSASTGVSAFASPRSTASSVGTGGGKTLVGLIRLMSSDICGGIVGRVENGVFCTLPEGECLTRTHKERKLDIRSDPRYYIQVGKNKAL